MIDKKKGYIISILLCIVLGTIIQKKSCCSDTETHTIKQSTTKEPIENTTAAFTILTKNGKLNNKNNDGFSFKISDFSLNLPLSKEIDSSIRSISAYLKLHPNAAIAITGLYSNKEVNNSAFPNLGIARATSIKNYMVSKGISSKKTNIFGRQDNTLKVHSHEIYKNPYVLKIITGSSTSKTKLEGIKVAINSQPLILHFKSSQASIILNDMQRKKINEIANYLDQVDHASIEIVGYTDNRGSRRGNIRLGQERANFAKEYLVINGIPENKIKTASKGPDDPIADNTTREGRAENRRTVVRIN